MTVEKYSLNMLDNFFHRKQIIVSLIPLTISWRISGGYISNFRPLINNDQLKVINDYIDNINFCEDPMLKLIGITLIDVCTYDTSSTSGVSQESNTYTNFWDKVVKVYTI